MYLYEYVHMSAMLSEARSTGSPGTAVTTVCESPGDVDPLQ